MATGGQLLADLQHMFFLPSSFYGERCYGIHLYLAYLASGRKECFQWQFAVVVLLAGHEVATSNELNSIIAECNSAGDSGSLFRSYLQ